MIVVEDLEKAYQGTAVLRGLSFRAEPKKVTLLVGANGAGKTTALRILSGLTRAQGGLASIDGIDVRRKLLAAQRRLSYLPQGVAFHPRLSCRALLRFYARLRDVTRVRADEMLERLGLQDHADKRSEALSGGLRQRLGLAILLLPDAPVLILDEPGLSLDPEWRIRMQELLQDAARQGKTVLAATHLLAEWEGMADRCLLCDKGRIVREIDPQHLRTAFRRSAVEIPEIAESP